jgi:hypothetical protein
MVKCKYLLKRQKNYKPIWWCKIKKQQVILPCYENCLELILKVNKPIKKVSNKRITVSKETYEKVFERDKGCCRLADTTCNGGLELHHIKYRSEAKDLIDEQTNCIMLCNAHHRLVHSNKHLWQPILLNKIKGEDK